MPRLASAAALLAAALPCTTAAQYSGSIGFHISRNDALPTSPHLAGLTFSSFGGPLGVRLNGALHFTRDRHAGYDYEDRIRIGAWSADADLIVAPFRMIGGVSPYGFIGIGGQGTRLRDYPDTSLMTWSYGAGLSMRLAGPLSIDGDARYRQPLDDDEFLPGTIRRDWEYRLGLTIGFGDRDRRGYHRASRPRSRSSPHKTSSIAGREHRRSSSALVRGAERHLGTRYRFGGDSPSEGFDCSGFVQYVYAREGIRLPRTARLMSVEGDRIELRLDALQQGDLMMFADNGSRIDHVAIYAGNGRILHATASGGGVRYDDLASPRGQWFMERWVAARRVADDDGSGVRGFNSSAPVEDGSLDPPDRAPEPPRR